MVCGSTSWRGRARPELVPRRRRRPAHGGLQHKVQAVQADRRRHLDPTHDGRFDIVELDPKVGDADGGHAAKLRSPISLGQCHGKSSWRRDAG
jgi:hypothetical protein